MSDAPSPMISLADRAAGKWQIPTFLVAVSLLAVVAMQVKSPDRKISIDDHLVALAEYNRLGMFAAACSQAEQLLTWEDATDAQRGAITLALARARYGRWSVGGAEAGGAEEVIAAYDDVQRLGIEQDAHDERNLAGAYEHLRRYELAVKHYRRAAELDPPHALADLRRVIELNDYPMRRPQAEIDALLDEYMQKAAEQPQELLWGLARRLEALTDAGESQQAAELLARYDDYFTGADLQNEYDYLIALTHRAAGRYDDAERLLRELLNRVDFGAPVYAKAGWLLGSVVMYDGRAQRPEEAIAIFRDVVASRAERIYVAAAQVAMAEALAGMQRHSEALTEYRDVVAELSRLPFNRLVNPDTLRVSLGLTADGASAVGLLAVAVECETLALGLVDEADTAAQIRHMSRLAEAQQAWGRALLATDAAAQAAPIGATALASAADGRQLLIRAAELRMRLAWLNTLNEGRASEEMWAAASLYDEAGDHDAAIELMRRFITERPDAEIVPRVLLRLGRSLQEAARYDEAVEVYQRSLSSFPRSPHANAALIPLAACLMALGEKHEAEAEEALRRIVDNSAIFTPQAPEFRDAMYLLADLFSRQDRHEEAIAVLDEILQRYPQDTRRPRAMFLLGQAHFKSAQAIKEELLKPEFTGDRKRLDWERQTRLDQARTQFHNAIQEIEARDPGARSDLEQAYLQEAHLSEAACLFELGQFSEALARYERSAWLYKESPAALGAYVQVINCDLFLGRPEDAETALRRAQFLVGSLTDEAYAQAGGLQTRDEWQRYFDWVAQTLTRTEE